MDRYLVPKNDAPEAARVQPAVAVQNPHDLHILKSAEEISPAMDNFSSKLQACIGSAKANLTATFFPQPAITTAAALHARVKATRVHLCDKGSENGCQYPRRVKGGQLGQPSVAISWSNSHKVTAQIHARKGAVVLKGRGAAMSQNVIRLVVPFLGSPTSALSNVGEA